VPVVVHTTGMQGLDWVGIVPVGASTTGYVAYQYATLNADLSFSGLAPGTYVARGFFNNGGTVIAESAAFTVADIFVTASASSFAGPISFTYGGGPDLPQNWIGLAVPGAPTPGYVAFQYVTSPTAGSGTFAAPAPGTYELRYYSNNSGNLLATSAPFTVTAGVVATPTATITHNAAGSSASAIAYNFTVSQPLPSNWAAVALPGAPANEYFEYQYVSTASGAGTFAGLPAGTYELRLFLDNTATLLASSTFTIGSSTGSGTASITVDADTFAMGEPVGFVFDRSSFTSADWVGLEPAGSTPVAYIDWQYLPATYDGSSFFAPPTCGQYVLRMYSNNSGNLLVESTVFTVQ
jgi:hypothetical protein